MSSQSLGTEYGIAGNPAPEFRFDTWLANTDDTPLRLSDLAEPIVYLYNFQSWCPGCHSHGFPTLMRIKEHFEANGRAEQIKFVAVQTVFEGHGTNTAEAAVESLERHGLTDIALGHDSEGPDRPPSIMVDYRTGGTPWTVIIGPGPQRVVLAEGFQVDADVAIRSLERLLDDLGHTEGLDEADRSDFTQRDESDTMNPTNNATTNTENTNTESTNKPSDAELRARLTPEQYQVTQHAGTERAFTGEYWDTKTPGRYRCVVCDAELFDSDAKYDSGSGWPSFHSEVESGRVHREEDRSHGMVRVEARCASCDAHLGHVFPDGPQPTGERYCMNSASLRLDPTGSGEPTS